MTYQQLRKLCHKIIHDKKFKKSEIKNIQINVLLSFVNYNDTLRIQSIILNSIVILYIKKLKYLNEDIQDLLHQLVYTTQKKIKQELSVKETLEDSYISDIIVRNNSQVQEMDFDDFSLQIEPQVNEESTLVSSFRIEVDKKRRKIEDDIIEYDGTFYRDNICELRPCKQLESRLNFDMENGLSSLNLWNKINIKKDIEMKEVEMIRDQTTFDEITMEDISIDNLVVEDSDISSTLILEGDFPNEFTFNVFVKGFSREKQACTFHKILQMAGEGKIECQQMSPSAYIQCFLIIH